MRLNVFAMLSIKLNVYFLFYFIKIKLLNIYNIVILILLIRATFVGILIIDKQKNAFAPIL